MSLVVVSLGNWHRSRVICRLKPVMLVGYGFCVKGIFLGSLRSSTFEPSILKAFYWWNRVMARCCGFGGQRAWDFISKELKEPRFRSYTVRFSKVCYYSSLILLWQALWLFFVPTSTVRFLSLTERRDNWSENNCIPRASVQQMLSARMSVTASVKPIRNR